MAFTVTPTSGSGPYTLSVDIINAGVIDGVNYVADVKSTTSVGSCPAVAGGVSFSQARIDELITTGSLVSESEVPSDSCRTYTLQIIRVSDGAVIDTSNAYVDNI